MQGKGGLAPNVLAFDTSLPQISAAVMWRDVLAEREEAMQRGQAERLMPLLEELLAEAGGSWRDLDLIAVGIGPGNFTGTRISVAAARGLALGLGIPAIGVSMFEALLDWDGPLYQPAEILSLEAPRGRAFIQHFRYGNPQSPPRLVDPAHPPADIELPVNMVVRGFRADEIARPFHAAFEVLGPSRVAAHMARIAEARWREKGFDRSARPAPLYVRPADAAPPSDPPPMILDDA
ncbi:tRNA threonylcarbamoyladenosine biosynthesis protein TsaB [Rhodovulum iodosum]|uniref:tRNA threonylcarbamoyladenosine biosynthesis protein TsaB n=1 Tax=Rhodovulum iodosum TaxID=68291 RepID=A0ABV3XSG0_9RHOB|nr:tRNA (adenosine(37)-N6)-threonylcarbamoyltransferase complex dimerization subunit type 1 TsaB [Rhodovulum robiginosum]RSK30589.1 tRNA (adenosine(37)-N6)-threonylcarbamoyltransferase complex dimerization subunit type 1 TsaB [Rhodovulum robiginosum]